MAGFGGLRVGNHGAVTSLTHNTIRGRVARYAVLGAIVLNIPTLIWAWYASTTTIIVGVIAFAVLGAGLGAIVGWSGAPNRWDRWWMDHRRRPHNPRTGRPGETLPPPDDLV